MGTKVLSTEIQCKILESVRYLYGECWTLKCSLSFGLSDNNDRVKVELTERMMTISSYKTRLTWMVKVHKLLPHDNFNNLYSVHCDSSFQHSSYQELYQDKLYVYSLTNKLLSPNLPHIRWLSSRTNIWTCSKTCCSIIQNKTTSLPNFCGILPKSWVDKTDSSCLDDKTHLANLPTS